MHSLKTFYLAGKGKINTAIRNTFLKYFGNIRIKRIKMVDDEIQLVLNFDGVDVFQSFISDYKLGIVKGYLLLCFMKLGIRIRSECLHVYIEYERSKLARNLDLREECVSKIRGICIEEGVSLSVVQSIGGFDVMSLK